MTLSRFASYLLPIVVLAGCGREDVGAKIVSGFAGYDGLPDSAEIARVGKAVLTKCELEREVDFICEMTRLRMPKASDASLKRIRRQMYAEMTERFVVRELFLAEAARAELKMPKEIDSAAVRDNFLAMSGNVAKDVPDLKARLTPVSAEVLDTRIFTDALVQTFLKVKAGESLVPTDAGYKTYCDNIDKLIAWSTNEHAKAIALGNTLVDRFRKGERFSALADEFSFAVKEGKDGPGGVWGEWMPSTLLDEAVRQAVKKTAVGDCTVPIETPEGLYIVLVESRTGSGDNSVVNLNPESVKLRRIVLRLPLAYEKMTRERYDSEWAATMFRNVQLKMLEKLRAKNTVTYPNGTNLWSVIEHRNVKKGVKSK